MKAWAWMGVMVVAACDGQVAGGPSGPAAQGTLPVVRATVAETPVVPVPSLPLAGPTVVLPEGDEVPPQTVVHPQASWPELASFGDELTGWTWEVVQPKGSVSLLRPSRVVRNPSFEANVAGRYEFRVTMQSRQGRTATATYAMVAVPDSALHVELLWHTPGDSDEGDETIIPGTDSVGSDMDLHLGFYSTSWPEAERVPSWFHEKWDCYWLNTQPNWNGAFMADDPSLDRDDTDGAGPENINLDVLEPEGCYGIAVSYWNDWGYGMSEATVRVYVMGLLVYERTTDMVDQDLWRVGHLCASDPEVFPEDLCDDTGCRANVEAHFPIPALGNL